MYFPVDQDIQETSADVFPFRNGKLEFLVRQNLVLLGEKRRINSP